MLQQFERDEKRRKNRRRSCSLVATLGRFRFKYQFLHTFQTGRFPVSYPRESIDTSSGQHFIRECRAWNWRWRLQLVGLTLAWCRGPESNWLRPPFQGGALPLSYPGTEQILETRSVRVKLSVELIILAYANYSCAESSNSRIQFRFFKTSRGLVPSGGPTMPSFSIRSIRRAARP